MIIKSAEFVKSASSLQGLPDTEIPEFAFIGRSNVGKSSLMNMLLSRKNLVKTSKKPGKTVLLNYFLINGSFHFVDLPGYGFASRGKSELELWKTIIEQYLVERKELSEIFLLIDARHGTMQNDLQMIEFLEHYRLRYKKVFTKIDKLNKNEVSLLKNKNNGCFFASAVTNEGREIMLDYINKKIVSGDVE